MASLALALIAFGACERPFVPEASPKIEVVEPGLEQVLTQPVIPVRIAATSFRPVTRVEIDGEALARSEATGQWQDTLHLEPGVNTFVVTAYDQEGVEGADTVLAVYLPLHVSDAAPALPEPRGGHTATLLANGDLLVTGGAPAYGGAASADTFLLPSSGSAFTTLDAKMTTPRAGHTATLLPDGRVLILGGALHDSLQSSADLVATAELYDPATRTFQTVPIEGSPVRRIYHTTAAVTSGGETEILVYGGIGVPPGSDEAEILGNLVRYTFRNDSLIADSTPIGAFVGEPIYGHTQTLLLPDAGPPRYLVAGAYFWTGEPISANFVLSLRADGGQDENAVAPFAVPRIRHAAVTLMPGLVALLGGHSFSASDVLSSGEVFVDASQEVYRLPEAVVLRKRFGQTATKRSSHRILVVGGFGVDGAGLTASEFLEIESD
ncbi:MAG TPA: kelch repeat-containing protein [Rhodothermales bacterium]|nr:kelch repeat-containing protein [Rhodothermales bacterium]